ncbi:MAG: hypothetical protein JWL59_4998 [Chthoniobacteraceae bacterium]|nr:hypothetical protein [Chthoniobacteraceae bacterium]
MKPDTVSSKPAEPDVDAAKIAVAQGAITALMRGAPVVEQISSVEQGETPFVNRGNSAHNNVLTGGKRLSSTPGKPATPESPIGSPPTIRHAPAKPVGETSPRGRERDCLFSYERFTKTPTSGRG